jgi:general secretion pathway protein N
MKARRRMLTGTAALLALAAALAVLPARWLLRVLPPEWPVTAVDASGTIWSGQAQLAVGLPGRRRTLPQAITWKWHWAAGVGPAAQVVHPWFATPVEIAPGLHGARLGQGSLTMPASALGTTGAPLNTLEPGGQLTLAWPALDLGDRPFKGPLLQLTWSRASSTRVPVQPLGDYQATLAADGAGGMDLRVRTLHGLLHVEGRSQDHAGRWRFDGLARPADDTDPAIRDALAPLLGALGTYRDGVSRMQYP